MSKQNKRAYTKNKLPGNRGVPFGAIGGNLKLTGASVIDATPLPKSIREEHKSVVGVIPAAHTFLRTAPTTTRKQAKVLTAA